ncbi:MAG: M24 family metallopeptidase [Pseudomonadota bacterium]
MVTARLIYDNPEKNADIYYATGFRAPDAFIFFEKTGKKYMVMSDLEIDRARRESKVDRVLSINPYAARAAGKKKAPGQADIVGEILADHGIDRLVVPGETPFTLVDALRIKGFRVEAGPTPFYPDRFVKGAEERRHILASQRVVFAAMGLARDVLASSRIRGSRIVYKGRTLTSGSLRTMINVFLLERGFVGSDTIVACGRHSIDPHDVGAGPLMPHKSIIVDIFPRSVKTGYFGDATRTFCKGRAPDALKRMYATVKDGQALGISMVRAGINGRKIHESIHALFGNRGYVSGEKGGRMQGFFHGTGHSVGLEIHEEPARIAGRDFILKAGNVMSVEPGLYYKAIGGVRIEDLVFVTKSGCDVLSGFPKKLEV